MSDVDIKEVEKFFYRAMVNGWAAGAKKIKLPNMPGYKGISFQDGDFRLLDLYCVGPEGSKSAGTTTIWLQDIPVWFMSFGGSYDKKAIPFLKSVLFKAYRAHKFFGGRGQFYYTDAPFSYMNSPRANDFSKFEGREEVTEAGIGKSLGWHEYWGMSLI